ncbi:hypothetical protein GCM10025883_19630 [Mobilicoccus caccae]|uniref:Uncharacterized protein n=1 Tax=Mobilicoccus caccae TaxID=1859295 RepID=A0ABQ6ITA9_9MICO|nr:hypothetical protein GCM10025883_19630 [Mobilicoccus caccae]
MRQTHVDQPEPFAQLVGQTRAGLARVVDLDRHEPAVLGVLDELAHGGAGHADAFGHLTLGQAVAVVELDRVEGLLVALVHAALLGASVVENSPAEHSAGEFRW